MKLSSRPSAAARSSISRPTSISEARPNPPSFARNSAGISSNSASVVGAPIASSMSRTSSAVCGMKGIVHPSVQWVSAASAAS
jgi:hypothetical protein